MDCKLTAEQLVALRTFLMNDPDSEQLAENEFVLDLYEHEPPVSFDLILRKDSLFIEGAAELAFDEEMDGWYICNRIEDVDQILSMIAEAGGISL